MRSILDFGLWILDSQSRLRLSALVLFATVGLLNGSLIAQESSPTESEPKEKSPPPSSLDDLLGIDEEEKGKSSADAAAKEADEELKRKLNEADAIDSLTEAVQKMSLSAELLDVKFDTGLGTQRVQEDIIAKLQQLIDQAKQQRNRSSSSSSSSSSQQQQQRDPQRNPGQQRNQQQQQQQPNQGNQRNQNPQDSQEGDPPPLQEGDINTNLDESRSEWGNLPPRVRDQLLQGRREKFSSLYERLTQEYYKRLAEEGNP